MDLSERVRGLLVVETTPGYEDLLIRETREISRGIAQLEERLEAAEEALAWIADWPHVKLYKGNETAYMPFIVHERAKATLRGQR